MNAICLKLIYLTPQIVKVELDNEISLALESDPVPGPGEVFLSPENYKQEPYKLDV